MPALSGTAEVVGEPGVRGDAAGTDNDGVQGFTASPARAGVIGINTSAGVGVKGVSEEHDAVQGFGKHPDHSGVLGTNDAEPVYEDRASTETECWACRRTSTVPALSAATLSVSGFAGRVPAMTASRDSRPTRIRRRGRY